MYGFIFSFDVVLISFMTYPSFSLVISSTAPWIWYLSMFLGITLPVLASSNTFSFCGGIHGLHEETVASSVYLYTFD